MTTVKLLLGGPRSEWPDCLISADVSGDWVAADRGAVRLLQMGIVPKLAVGDFDSMTIDERQHILTQLPRVVQVKPEKDDTDTELLLHLVEETYHPDEIEIYGATGGRIDHLLSNIWIFTQERFRQIATKVKIIDRTNVIQFFLPGDHAITRIPEMTYLGFMNLTPVINLTLYDEKYRLTNWSSHIPFSYSSNEFEGEINHFKFESGMVAVIQSRDLYGQTED